MSRSDANDASHSPPVEHQTGDGPMVSVLTPSYNRADLLDETIRSVLSQTGVTFEYLILDDGSTDRTPEVVAPYMGQLTYARHDNQGEQRTVNRLLEMAKGRYVIVVNSDDPIRPGCLATLVAKLEQRPELVVAYPDWTVIDQGGHPIKSVQAPEHDLARMLLFHECPVGPGAMIRRSALQSSGVRDPQFRFVADFDLWLRLSLVGPFCRVPENLAQWRSHAGAATEAARGRAMAIEHVEVIRAFFRRNDLPPEVQRLRRRARSWSHYAAAHHAGKAHFARLWHILLWMVMAPDNLLAWWRRHRSARPDQSVFSIVARRLRGVLE